MANLPFFWQESIRPEEALELEVPLYSKREVASAGKLLAGTIPVTHKSSDEVLQAFKIAWNWRNSHILPMRRLRSELSHKARRVNPLSVSAARPKRMKSIRKKLRKGRSLYDIQDIAGCRAIMGTIGEVELLSAGYQDRARHIYHDGDDYITTPRSTGYRSRHLIYKFDGQGEEEVYRRQLVEIQIRTQLQHAWATAVEAVGLVRNEELKAGEGDQQWLRFFALMSSEFAAEEDCPIVPNTPENARERREEIRDLVQELDAVRHLDSYRELIHHTGKIETRGGIFMVQYDPEDMSVSARPFASYAIAAEKMRGLEIGEDSRKRKTETVLVEVDKAADLRSAYPNYFLDVGMFVERLGRIIQRSPKTVGHRSKLTQSFNPWFSWRRGR